MSILFWMDEVFFIISTYKLWTIIFKIGCMTMSYSGQNLVVFEEKVRRFNY
jgi:hypothetical protein